MSRLGLSGSQLAQLCSVSKEAVSNWLSGESLPRPAKLAALARALQLSVDALIEPDASAPPEPIVAFRTRNGELPSPEEQQVGEEVGRHLRQLVPFLDLRLTSRRLLQPSLDPLFIHDAAMATRRALGLDDTEAATTHHLIQAHRAFGALLVPVYWGGDRVGHDNALSIYLPDSQTSWVLLNVGSDPLERPYWLAHELAHSLTLHALQGADGEAFAELFATHLLGPPRGEVGEPEDFAQRLGSPAGGDPSIGRAGERLRPSMLDLVSIGAAAFGSEAFLAMAHWQRENGAPSPSFIAGALNIPLGDAIELSKVLWDLPELPPTAVATRPWQALRPSLVQSQARRCLPKRVHESP